MCVYVCVSVCVGACMYVCMGVRFNNRYSRCIKLKINPKYFYLFVYCLYLYTILSNNTSHEILKASFITRNSTFNYKDVLLHNMIDLIIRNATICSWLIMLMKLKNNWHFLANNMAELFLHYLLFVDLESKYLDYIYRGYFVVTFRNKWIGRYYS